MSLNDPGDRADLRALIAALGELEHQERLVFQLCAVDGLDYPAIADRLSISVTDVERLLASALLALDRHFDDASRGRNLAGSAPKRRTNRLHRLMRWLGSD